MYYTGLRRLIAKDSPKVQYPSHLPREDVLVACPNPCFYTTRPALESGMVTWGSCIRVSDEVVLAIPQ